MDRLRERFTNEDDNYEKRKCTNINWFYFMIFFFTLMFVSIAYSGFNSDIRRFTKGYDDCGYLCGLNNIQRNVGQRCQNSNKKNFPKVQIDNENAKCVPDCPSDYKEIMNRCFKVEKDNNSPDSKFEFLMNDLALTAPTIALVCCVALVFSYILLLLFRHCAHYAVWGITISSVSLLIAFAGYLWYLFATIPITNIKRSTYLTNAIIWSFLALVSLIVVICVRKRIKLVIQLFKETSKVLFDIPALMAQPIMTLFATALAIAPFIGFQLLIETSGTLEMDPKTSKINLQQNAFIKMASVLNIMGFFWFTQFIIGCQHFIIAGTVSKWYFVRDKTKLSAPMKTTYYNLFWFHLGSICLGSWMITIIKIIRITLKILYRGSATSRNIAVRLFAFFINWLIAQLDFFFRYLIRNAYIIVAKDGLPFIEAASKSTDLIFNNLIDVLALNHVGDLVLSMGRLFVVVIAGFVGYEAMKGQTGVTSIFFPLFIAVILSFVIVHCLVTIFEMTVDTIFLCYCEDMQSNDGSAQNPYFMSFGLKNVMEELKGYEAELKKPKVDEN